jgi:hypothetical protein
MKKNKPSAEKARRAMLRKKRLKVADGIPKCGLCDLGGEKCRLKGEIVA